MADADDLASSRALADRARLVAAFSAAPTSPRHAGRARRVFIVTYRLPVVLSRHGPGRWSAAWVEDDITAKTPNSIAGDVATQWVGVVTRECFDPEALAALIEGGDAGAGEFPPAAVGEGDGGAAAGGPAAGGAADGARVGLTGAVAGGLGALAWAALVPGVAAVYGSADGATPASPDVLASLAGSGGVDADGRVLRMAPCPPLSAADMRGITAALNAMAVLPVFLPPALHEGFATYVLTVLKPAMHNVIETGTQRVQPKAASLDFLARGWEHFSAANEALAAVLLAQHAADDIVWWHDFWLMRAPLLFARGVAAAAPRGAARPAQVFYMHAPFPTSEIFRTLPVRDELLAGILQCDVVGFHSFNYARHFLHACKRLLGVPARSRPGGELALDVDGRDVLVTISHVGVEAGVLDAFMAAPEAAAVAGALRAAHAGKIVLAGMDPLERLSGVALKLLAFETLLEENPVYRGRVVLVQRCESARMALPADVSRTSRELRERAASINAAYPGAVDYEVAHSFSPAYRMGLFHAANVLLQTPICEGLNLLPLEYVYARTRWQLARAHEMDDGAAPAAPARAVPPSPLAAGALADATLKAVSTGMPQAYANTLSGGGGGGGGARAAAPLGGAATPLPAGAAGPLRPPDAGGCVILSEFSTASQALNSNLVVNPWAIRAVAREIDKAIAMPDPERSFRQWRDYQYAIRNPSATWSRAVIRDALGARAEREAEAAAARGDAGGAGGAGSGAGGLSRSAAARSRSSTSVGAMAGGSGGFGSGADSGSRTPAAGAGADSGSRTPAAAGAEAGGAGAAAGGGSARGASDGAAAAAAAAAAVTGGLVIGGGGARAERSCVPPLDHSAVASAFEESRGERVILLDYGGTLVDRSAMLGRTEGFGNRHDFHTDGYSQTLPPATLAAVAALAAAPRTTLFVISGLRASAVDALQVSTLDAVGLAAENGMFTSQPARVGAGAGTSGADAAAGAGAGASGAAAAAGAGASATTTTATLPARSPLARERSSVGLRGPSSRAVLPLLPASPPPARAAAAEAQKLARAWATTPLAAPGEATAISLGEWAAIKAASIALMSEYEARVSGSVVREYDGVALWDFRPADAEWAAGQAAFLVADLRGALAEGGAGFSAATAARDVAVTLSKSRVEVALRCMNKGRCVGDILARAAGAAGAAGVDFVLCVGDDVNDEEMFAALRGEEGARLLAPGAALFTATVGKKARTSAGAYCLDVATVGTLLGRIAEGEAARVIAE